MSLNHKTFDNSIMVNNIASLVLLGSVLLVGQILSAPCNCGLGIGVNSCSGQTHADGDGDGTGSDDDSYPLVVRPQNLPTIDIGELTKPGTPTYEKIVSGESNIAPLKPIGDVCSCGKTIVIPAHVPKPTCAGCAGSVLEDIADATLEQALQGGQTDQTQDAGGVVVNFPECGLPVVGPSRPVNYGSQAPADAVSRALAYQQLLTKQHAVEHELQYGFKTTPKEVVAPTYHQPTFHEENLYRHNGDILELGNLYQAPDVDEIAIADLEEEEPEEEIAPIQVQPITLGSLGFVAHNPKPHFTNVEVTNPYIHPGHTSPCGVDVVSHCDDGYRSGQVIIKEEPVYLEPVLPHKTDYDVSGGPHDTVYSYPNHRFGSSGRVPNTYHNRRGGCL